MATHPSEVALASYARLLTLDRPTLVFDPKIFAERPSEERIDARLATEALKTLSPLQQAALVLTRRDGLSCDDIARLIGISPDEVRQAFASGLLLFVRYVARARQAESVTASS